MRIARAIEEIGADWRPVRETMERIAAGAASAETLGDRVQRIVTQMDTAGPLCEMIERISADVDARRRQWEEALEHVGAACRVPETFLAQIQSDLAERTRLIEAAGSASVERLGDRMRQMAEPVDTGRTLRDAMEGANRTQRGLAQDSVGRVAGLIDFDARDDAIRELREENARLREELAALRKKRPFGFYL